MTERPTKKPEAVDDGRAQRAVPLAVRGDLYAAYCKGWDDALKNAAMSFWGRDREAILSHLRREREMALQERPAPQGGQDEFDAWRQA